MLKMIFVAGMQPVAGHIEIERFYKATFEAPMYLCDASFQGDIEAGGTRAIHTGGLAGNRGREELNAFRA